MTALVGLLSCVVGAQEPPAAPAAEPATGAAIVRIKGLEVDRAAGTLTIGAEVCLREGPLEFLLCGWGTKEHESVLHTRVRPSDVHAGLLLLGLAPGKPVRWSRGEGREPRLLPPAGARLSVEVRWKEAGGTIRREKASAFIASEDGSVRPPEYWVFVGSSIAPDGRYRADAEGELISVANFPASVLDVPLESSNDNALLEFVARTPAIPPIGTLVDVILTPLPGAATAADARVTIDIDARGDFHLDGRPTDSDALFAALRQFSALHSAAQAVVRAHPRARVFDVARAREVLWTAGVRDVHHEWPGVYGIPLPRSPDQFEAARKLWSERLANPQDYIRDPFELAAETLQRVAHEAEELRLEVELLQRYSDYLRAIVARGEQGHSGDGADADSPRRSDEEAGP